MEQQAPVNASIDSLGSKHSSSSQTQDQNLLAVGFPAVEVQIGAFRGQPVFIWKFLVNRSRVSYTESDYHLLREVRGFKDLGFDTLNSRCQKWSTFFELRGFQGLGFETLNSRCHKWSTFFEIRGFEGLGFHAPNSRCHKW